MNFARRVDELALCALEREVRLEGKPGLVSPASRGSHDDMDLSTFLASLTALRGYFGDCARLGSASEDFGALQRRGLAAEQAMFTATDGVNTHKGAVFTLGLLCAAAGWQWTALGRLEVSCLGQVVTERWGDAIHATALAAPVDSHGAQLRRRHGLPGRGNRPWPVFRCCSAPPCLSFS